MRMLNNDKKKMAEFHEDYKEACYTKGGHALKVGGKEKKMLEMYHAGKSIKQIADISKLSESQVRTRLFYVAVKK